MYVMACAMDSAVGPACGQGNTQILTHDFTNRMHMDIYGDTQQILAAGARLVRARGGDIEWDVLADPEGNEFCVFAEP